MSLKYEPSSDPLRSQVEMESILLRFFRPNPNLMEQLREVSSLTSSSSLLLSSLE